MMVLVLKKSTLAVIVGILTYEIYLPNMASADDRKFQLGDQRLFMSSEQRKDIDQQAFVTVDVPEVELPVAVVVEKKAKLPDSKITLHGAVIRPDGSTTLFMSNGTRNIAANTESQADQFSFRVNVKSKVLVLKPGQTVWVKNSHD